ERAEKLAVDLAALRARLARADLAVIAERRAAADDRRQAAALARRTTQEGLSALLAERERAETELSDAAGAREAALGALYRLQGAVERIGLRRESAAGLAARLAEDLVEAERAVAARSDSALRALEEVARLAATEAREAASNSGQAAERARQAHARLAAHERAGATEAERRLAELRARRQEIEAAVAEATGGQAGANRALIALGVARERLSARLEASATIAAGLRSAHDEAQAAAARGGPSPTELEQAANDAAASARAAVTARDDLVELERATRERLAALERSLAEREGVAPAARALADAGERLARAAPEAEPGAERAVAAALAWRASALLAADPERGLELLDRARADGLGSLAVVVGGGRASTHPNPPSSGARPLRELVRGAADALTLLDGVWLVDDDRLLDATHGIVVTAAGHGYDVGRAELWFAGETAEAVLLEMDARRRGLVDEVAALTTRVTEATTAAVEAAERAAEAEAAFAAVAHLRDVTLDVPLAARLAGAAEALEEQLRRATTAVRALEAPVTVRVDQGARRAAELGDELRRIAPLEADAQRSAADGGRRAQEAELVVARLGGTLELVPGEGDRETLALEAAAALAAADAAAVTAREAADRARAADAALVERAPRRSTLDVDLVGRLGAAVGELGRGLERAAAAAARLETPVRARADAGAERAGTLGAELRRLGADEVELRRRADEAAERTTAVEVELARLDSEREEAERRLADAVASVTRDEGAQDPSDEADPTDAEELSRDELASRIQRLESRREALGRVNPLAKEEYEAEKERLEDLAAQRADLEASLAELEKLRDELAETVQRRFDDTFAAVAANFEEVAGTLCPGGEGRLRLVEPDEEGGEPGVEVELRPAGKKITRLTLLSGGEKALGAISFLFALFLAKPCPFYLLDEVEAALDDTNIARFVELLRRYADRAQFIVITHQKRTMEAADVLYGVTMGGDGVSQIVSRRLPRDERSPVAVSA
ncbi:MAG: AAA family ATPase, partial [Gaiella sp.]